MSPAWVLTLLWEILQKNVQADVTLTVPKPTGTNKPVTVFLAYLRRINLPLHFIKKADGAHNLVSDTIMLIKKSTPSKLEAAKLNKSSYRPKKMRAKSLERFIILKIQFLILAARRPSPLSVLN